MGQSRYLISVEQCPDSGALVGTSDDIPGLILEADTIGQILDAAMDVVPHLLYNNLGLADLGDVVIEVAVRLQRGKRETAVRADEMPPRFVVEPIAAVG